MKLNCSKCQAWGLAHGGVQIIVTLPVSQNCLSVNPISVERRGEEGAVSFNNHPKVSQGKMVHLQRVFQNHLPTHLFLSPSLFPAQTAHSPLPLLSGVCFPDNLSRFPPNGGQLTSQASTSSANRLQWEQGRGGWESCPRELA